MRKETIVKKEVKMLAYNKDSDDIRHYSLIEENDAADIKSSSFDTNMEINITRLYEGGLRRIKFVDENGKDRIGMLNPNNGNIETIEELNARAELEELDALEAQRSLDGELRPDGEEEVEITLEELAEAIEKGCTFTPALLKGSKTED